MDIGAYTQIENFGKLASDNGIAVPRLRGYRLMKDEEKVTWKDLAGEDFEFFLTKSLVTSVPFWNANSNCSTYSAETRRLLNYYCPNGEVCWEKIHGWKRRTLKTLIKREKQKYIKQAEVWNKYAGKENILYIHARIGGGNWPYYYQEVVHQPWFLEKVDDADDSTYCDIYAKLETLDH